MEYIKWLKELSKEDVAIAGGKGANLAELYNKKFPVPPAFILTTKAYNIFLDKNKLAGKIYPLLDKLDVEDNEKLQETSQKIKELITNSEIPADIKFEIVESYDNMNVNIDIIKLASRDALNIIKAGRDFPYVAIRSSATAEDSENISFAGQMSTYLNIKGNKNVLEAVKKCWASLFTARAIYYRVKNSIEHKKVLMAVIVEKMVNSDSAGVIFSVNPVNKNELLIEAGYGLGEAVVSGSIIPDSYTLNKETLEIKNKNISEKKFGIFRDSIKGNIKKEISEDLKDRQVLSDFEIIGLAKLANKIEEYYGKPQDVEFAIENKNIFIVQSRPITTLKKPFIEEIKEENIIGETKGPILSGLNASPGVGYGKVKLVKDITELSKIKEGDVLVTRMTKPDFVPAMKRASAIVTDAGGLSSHAAIVSRELEIPCIVGTEKATQILKENEFITVDGTSGKVYKGKVEIKEEKEEFEEVTTATKIYMNLGEPEKIDEYKNLNFDGIGLMRVEFIIADYIKKHPKYLIEINQENVYINKLSKSISRAASAVDNKEIIVRFSDFKTNEYRDLEGGSKYEEKEENPMIGFRGVSRYISKEFEEIFRLECRAIKKVREFYKNVHVMLPFVRTTWEVEKCLEIMNDEYMIEENLKIFLMAEVPSMALIPEEFAKLPIDGVSIGSNDLTQLVLGVDRDSAKLGKMNYFDERNPAVLKAIKRIIKGFHKYHKIVSICGQAPSIYPEIVDFLVKNGIDSISVNPDALNKVRSEVAKVEKNLLLEFKGKF